MALATWLVTILDLQAAETYTIQQAGTNFSGRLLSPSARDTLTLGVLLHPPNNLAIQFNDMMPRSEGLFILLA